MFKTYKKIWSLLLPKERKKGFVLILLMIVYGFVEMGGIISIFPLVAVLSDPEIIGNNKYLTFFYTYFEFENIDQFLIFLTAIVFFVTVTRTLFNGFINHNILRYTQMRNKSMSTRLLYSYLNRPYVYFLSRHSADMGKTILSEVEDVISSSLIPALELISRLIVSSFILIAIFLADPYIATTSLFTLTFSYGIIYLLLRSYLLKKGAERVKANRNRYMIAQEVLIGIKEIKVRNATDAYLQNFNKATSFFHQLRINTSLAKLIPQLFIQIAASGGILIVILVLLTQKENYNQLIPLVALYAFAAMRILPVLQGIFKNLTSLRSGTTALSLLSKEIKYNVQYTDKSSNNFLDFNKNIFVDNVSFSYPESKSPVINNLTLNIEAKTSVAFVGTTGSGKSTTTDLLLGLLEPQKGSIRVDGIKLSQSNIKSWQKLIGYVPQSIFLADDSIAKNIALGCKEYEIDYERIEFVAKLANLHEFIEEDLISGYSTKVGEAGVKLSGGQRQRIGIARALYRGPKILIFDEATSSLDNLTEQTVMNSINKLKNTMTIIMVAHRLSTIKECDKIYHLENGKLRSQGTFSELFSNDQLFKDMAAKFI